MSDGELDSIAKARLATAADLAAIARVHKIAYSRSHFTALLPEATLMRYYGEFLGDGTEIRLAQDDSGVIQGFAVYGIGIPDKIAAFKKACAKDILLTSLKHPWTSARKAMKAVAARLGRHTPHQSADFLLLSIAVVEPLRGVGKTLLRATMAAARQQAHPRLGLYVNDDNIRAINAYQVVGFRMKSFHDGQYYMEADLSG